MKFYFDMDIYNRIFDDPSQMKVRFESMAVDSLFELIEQKNDELMWSFILDYENGRNPFIERRLHIKSLSTLCKGIIKPNEEILSIAKDIMHHSNAKNKDALHLAAAINSHCDYFITCDDKFIRTIERNREALSATIQKIRLYNPIDFLRREMDIDVIE